MSQYDLIVHFVSLFWSSFSPFFSSTNISCFACPCRLFFSHPGATRKLAITKQVFCDKCGGRGTKSASITPQRCRTCNGSGSVVRTEHLGPSIIQRYVLRICFIPLRLYNPQGERERSH